MNADTEKSTYSTFEKFLYWFFIPLVFTVICLAVLFSLFDYNVMKGIQRSAHKLPLVGTFVPAPQETASTASGDGQSATDADKAKDQEIASLKQKAADWQSQYEKADASSKQKDQQIKDLQAKNDTLDEQQKTKAKTDEEYQAQIAMTADTYAKMNPSKSAPLMENLTLNERVLILGAMKTDDRVKVLEKMDPKIAAESSILLKDVVPVQNRQIAALQERLKVFEDAVPKSGQKLTAADIGLTFANMAPKSAAAILLEMEATDPSKVTEILTSADVQSRSKIMNALADTDKDAAAKISARLSP